MSDNSDMMDAQKQRNRRILSARMEPMYRQLPFIGTIPLLGGLLFAVLQHEYVSQATTLSWYLLVVLVNGLGAAFMYLVWRRDQDRLHKADRLHSGFAVFAMFCGLVWGGPISFVYLPELPRDHQLIVYVWLWAMAAMISASTVASRRIFYACVMPVLLPLALSSAWQGGFFNELMAVSTLVYLGSLMVLYKVNHETFVRAISLHFENIELIDKLKIKQREAENANREKSRFLAAASHDLRQPVHAQGLFLAELDDYVEHPHGRRLLAGLENSIEALRKLFDSVLDVARLDAGVVAPRVTDFSLSALFDEIGNEFAPQLEEQEIDFTRMPTRLVVRSDRTLLGRVLRNLVTNALRYAGGGRVLLGVRRQSGAARIEVHDTGIGIDARELTRVFDEFYQIGNPERDRDKGAGLGLAIVQRTAQLLNSPLTVRSAPGKGSLFAITVPLGTAAAGLPEASPRSADVAGLNVLLVEDEKQIREVLTAFLQHRGCVVRQAATGEQALLAGDAAAIDVMVVDYRLPGSRNGLQVIDAIRQRRKAAIPAVLVSGDIALGEAGSRLGSGTLLVHKPVSPGNLLAAIGDVRAGRAGPD